MDESAADPLTPVQLLEILSRLEAHERDPSFAVPWEQVRSELFQVEAEPR